MLVAPLWIMQILEAREKRYRLLRPELHVYLVRVYVVIGNCCLGAILTDYASFAFHRWESLTGGLKRGL